MCYQYPRVLNFTPFHSTTRRFWDTAHFKTTAPNDPKITLNITRANVLIICVTSILESEISLRFGPRPAIFKISHILWFPIDYHVKQPEKEQHQKKKKKKKTQKLQNFKFRNSSNNFGRDPLQGYTWIFGSKSGAYFQRWCRLKLSLPCSPMLMKTKKKWQKSKIWNFTMLWTILVETLLASMHDIGGVNLVCTFRGDVAWNFYSHMIPC